MKSIVTIALALFLGLGVSRGAAVDEATTNGAALVVFDATLIRVGTNRINVVTQAPTFTDGALLVRKTYSSSKELRPNQILTIEYIESTDSRFIGSNMTVAATIDRGAGTNGSCRLVCSGISRAAIVAAGMLKSSGEF